MKFAFILYDKCPFHNKNRSCIIFVYAPASIIHMLPILNILDSYYSISDPCPPAFMYSFEALWCIYYDYHHSLSWGETREFCAGICDRMATALESLKTI